MPPRFGWGYIIFLSLILTEPHDFIILAEDEYKAKKMRFFESSLDFFRVFQHAQLCSGGSNNDHSSSDKRSYPGDSLATDNSVALLAVS